MGIAKTSKTGEASKQQSENLKPAKHTNKKIKQRINKPSKQKKDNLQALRPTSKKEKKFKQITWTEKTSRTKQASNASKLGKQEDEANKPREQTKQAGQTILNVPVDWTNKQVKPKKDESNKVNHTVEVTNKQTKAN